MTVEVFLHTRRLVTLMSDTIVFPDSRFDMVSFGELVSEPSRVSVLLALMDGLARPASELARLAGVTPQTASSHLQRLLAAGLLRVERSGRHRYFCLASEQVAEARWCWRRVARRVSLCRVRRW